MLRYLRYDERIENACESNENKVGGIRIIENNEGEVGGIRAIPKGLCYWSL